MPKDFDITVEQAPRVHIVKQYILPDFMRVTITRNGTSEWQDFH